ncbi:unnamed protein product [marine sediment metagenome]|uniref:Uncharacterized protein n=1 Tax=marine sediment metagenome TaxID=412755 RepID=X0S778_9ZZZZ
MISLHITLYTQEVDDRFKITAVDPESGEPSDVTDQYEVVAAATPEGREGFAVFRKEQNCDQPQPEGTE